MHHSYPNILLSFYFLSFPFSLRLFSFFVFHRYKYLRTWNSWDKTIFRKSGRKSKNSTWRKSDFAFSSNERSRNGRIHFSLSPFRLSVLQVVPRKENAGDGDRLTAPRSNITRGITNWLSMSGSPYHAEQVDHLEYNNFFVLFHPLLCVHLLFTWFIRKFHILWKTADNLRFWRINSIFQQRRK